MAETEMDPTANPGPDSTDAPSSHLWKMDVDENGVELDTSAEYDAQLALPVHMLEGEAKIADGRVVWVTVCGIVLNDPDRTEILRSTDVADEVTCEDCQG